MSNDEKPAKKRPDRISVCLRPQVFNLFKAWCDGRGLSHIDTASAWIKERLCAEINAELSTEKDDSEQP